jgi:selenide,water dikinase
VGYREMVDTTTQLNRVGAKFGEMTEVHALTDVTGFALLGHLLEMCRGSKLGATIHYAQLPILPTALHLAQHGYATGAAERNWASYGAEVNLPKDFPEWQRKLLCDPQTSGGLLVACAPSAVDKILVAFHADGFVAACAVGQMEEGAARVRVE